MRIVVFFDLPTLTSEDRKEYRAFRKYLLRSGFVMMQESVYSKIVLNNTAESAVVKNLKERKTKKGVIQVLVVTERQFERMEFLVGERQNTVIDSDQRLVIL